MQTSLMPDPKKQFFDDNGDPLAGGKVYFYETGTTTLKTVYADSAGATALPNPVILDSYGRAIIFLNGYYKVKLTDSSDVTIYTVDNVSSEYSQTTANYQWTDQDDTLTYISTTQFSIPTNKVTTYEVGRRIKATVTAGTIYGTITASSAGGAPVITTVTCMWDSGSLDSGLSAVALGILTITNSSFPYPAIVEKTANYTGLITDYRKTIMFSGAGVAFTLPAANAVPNGFELKIMNSGANALTLVGTVNGHANRTMLSNESADIFSNGTAWSAYNLHNEEPIGTVKAWHKSLTGVPQTLPWGWVECTGQALSDAESPLDGETMPDLNNNGRFIRGANTSGNTQANQNLEHLHNNVLAGTGVNDINMSNGDNNIAKNIGSGSGSLAAGTAVQFVTNSLRLSSNDIVANMSFTNANSGSAEARPDNISMVFIIKVK